MKKILFLFFILFILFIYGCSKEETTEEPMPIEKITAKAYDVDKLEITEDDEAEEEIVTVRLCHDTDNGMVRWANGSVFGFYDNAKRIELKDYCFDNNILVEYYCENEMPQNMTFICTNGCKDNHCL